MSNTIKYLLWFALGLTLATGTVVSQNLTLSEQLLTNMFAAQTNKSQITQVADGAGNIIASTSNNLNVQCANCSGSGASAADAATFTAGSSTFAPAGGEFTSGGATACVTAHQCMVAMTAGRGFFSDINTWAETSLGVPTAYGVAPTTGNYIGVNAFVTNASPGIANNADGVTAVGASATSPVPVDNYNYVFNGSTWDRAPGSTTGAQIKVASGGIVSGAFASGAFAAGSFVNATAGDPCMFQLKTNVPISTASGTVALVTGVSAKKIYVCSLSLVTSGAVAVSLAEGSSSTCGTSNQAAVLGVATNGTAANGISLAANGGLTLGNGGGTVAQTATNANYLCLFQSGTTQMAGNLTYVQQ